MSAVDRGPGRPEADECLPRRARRGPARPSDHRERGVPERPHPAAGARAEGASRVERAPTSSITWRTSGDSTEPLLGRARRPRV